MWCCSSPKSRMRYFRRYCSRMDANERPGMSGLMQRAVPIEVARVGPPTPNPPEAVPLASLLATLRTGSRHGGSGYVGMASTGDTQDEAAVKPAHGPHRVSLTCEGLLARLRKNPQRGKPSRDTSRFLRTWLRNLRFFSQPLTAVPWVSTVIRNSRDGCSRGTPRSKPCAGPSGRSTSLCPCRGR